MEYKTSPERLPEGIAAASPGTAGPAGAHHRRSRSDSYYQVAADLLAAPGQSQVLLGDLIPRLSGTAAGTGPAGAEALLKGGMGPASLEPTGVKAEPVDGRAARASETGAGIHVDTDEDYDAAADGSGGGAGKGRANALDTAGLDPRRAKRILANRQSAQRSRMKRLQHVHDLENQTADLSGQIKRLQGQLASERGRAEDAAAAASAAVAAAAALQQQLQQHEALQAALQQQIAALRAQAASAGMLTLMPGEAAAVATVPPAQLLGGPPVSAALSGLPSLGAPAGMMVSAVASAPPGLGGPYGQPGPMSMQPMGLGGVQQPAAHSGPLGVFTAGLQQRPLAPQQSGPQPQQHSPQDRQQPSPPQQHVAPPPMSHQRPPSGLPPHLVAAATAAAAAMTPANPLPGLIPTALQSNSSSGGAALAAALQSTELDGDLTGMLAEDGDMFAAAALLQEQGSGGLGLASPDAMRRTMSL